jgi:hypothetical protein
MALTTINDHVARALARLLTQNRNSLSHRGLVSAFVNQAQALEDALFAFLLIRNVDTATSAQLDEIGAIIGQPREARTDTDYRLWIHARILLNKGSGEIETLIAVADLLFPGASIRLVEIPPAGAVIFVEGAVFTSVYARQVANILRTGKAGGVALRVRYQVADDAHTFVFGATSAGLGFGDTSNPSTGGQLSGVA